MTLQEFQSIAMLVALVIGLTQITKGFVKNEKFYPLISLALGIALSLLVFGLGVVGLLTGIVIGLSASGLYSGATTIVKPTITG